MRFTSDSFGVGVYQFQSVIGNGRSSREPIAMSSVFPDIESFYKTVAQPTRFSMMRALVSFQLGQQIPDGLVLQVHLYKRRPLIEQKLVSTSDDAPLELLTVLTLHIEPNLAIWEDQGTQLRHMWRVSRSQEINLSLDPGERLLVLLTHENVQLTHCSVEVVLK